MCGSYLARVSVVGRVVLVFIERVLWRCGDGHVRMNIVGGVLVVLLEWKLLGCGSSVPCITIARMSLVEVW